MQEFTAHQTVDILKQRVRGQRPGCDNHRPAAGDLSHFAVGEFNQRMAGHAFGDKPREGFPVYRERAARFHLGFVGAAHDQAAQPAKLLLEQPRRVGKLIRAQRVGAHQLGQVI